MNLEAEIAKMLWLTYEYALPESPAYTARRIMEVIERVNNANE